jgi:hypothetical protein
MYSFALSASVLVGLLFFEFDPDLLANAYCRVCHTLYHSLSEHRFDFWDKLLDKRFGRLEPYWIQQPRKDW